MYTYSTHTQREDDATGGKDALVGDHVDMENIATTDLAGLDSAVVNVSIFDPMFIFYIIMGDTNLYQFLIESIKIHVVYFY